MNSAVVDTPPVSIYIDGSCIENRNVTADTAAGWGFVVVIGDRGVGRGTGDLMHESSGPVITNPNSDEWLGAEVGSNNTGELSAMVHALRWILVNCSKGEVTIRADSMYALRITDGAWSAKANKKLAHLSQELWKEVAQVVDLHNAHVKAHSGHRWNERADHLAYRGQGDDDPIPLQFWRPGQR
ncbi:MAG: hypothetical protein CMB12_05075 [Euryarchaeota archaeon]|nr:hypothetical protein [Euryarchaeota archaeon]